MDVLKKTCLQSTTISQTKDLVFKKGYYYDEVDCSNPAPLSSILSESQQSFGCPQTSLKRALAGARSIAHIYPTNVKLIGISYNIIYKYRFQL